MLTGSPASPRPKPPLAFHTLFFSFSRLSESLEQATTHHPHNQSRDFSHYQSQHTVVNTDQSITAFVSISSRYDFRSGCRNFSKKKTANSPQDHFHPDDQTHPSSRCEIQEVLSCKDSYTKSLNKASFYKQLWPLLSESKPFFTGSTSFL